MSLKTKELLSRLDKDRIWNHEPVFCFTSDVDWASEAALDIFLSDMQRFDLKFTMFVTHRSDVVEEYKKAGVIERGIHPNFLPGSSHGDGFRSVIETVLEFAPEAKCFRSHRGFDVTDITHLLTEYGMEYDSNVVTIMQQDVKPILHESGLLRFPIFFEDGTHLYNRLGLDLDKYKPRFTTPGIKIISIHPVNYVVNPPTIKYMRSIKDSISREEYIGMSQLTIEKHRYNGDGIVKVVDEIIQLAKNYRILTLSELYSLAIS